MSWRHEEPAGRVQKASYVLLVSAVALVLVTGGRAWRVGPLPTDPTDVPELRIPELGQRITYRAEDAVRAVRRDPFHPDRRGPTARYLLPEPESAATVSAPTRPSAEAMRLLGTVVNESNGGFVMVQFGGDAPSMVHVGDTLAGLRLHSVSRASAAFIDTLGDTVTVQLPGVSAGAGG